MAENLLFLKDLQLIDIVEDPYFKQLFVKYPEIREILELRKKESQSDVYSKKNIANLNSALQIEMSKLDRLPDISWVSRKNTLNFQKEIMSSYFRDVIKGVLSEKGYSKIMKKMEVSKDGATRYIKEEYNYLEPAALETLQKTHKILIYLKYLG